MAHAAAGRGGLPGDEGDDGLCYVIFRIGRGALFVAATDLTDNDYRVCLVIFLEEPKHILMRRPDDRIAADANSRRLAESNGGKLSDRLVRERSRAGNDANPALFMN